MHIETSPCLSWKEPLSVKASFMSLNSSLEPSLLKLIEPMTLTDFSFILQQSCTVVKRPFWEARGDPPDCLAQR